MSRDRRVRGLGAPSKVFFVFGPDPLLFFEELVTRLVEFSLVDTTQERGKRWFVGGFYPLTSQDVQEQRRIHGVTTGIPIADDLDKGVYFVTSDGRVMFRAPGRAPDVTEVAPSVEAFSRFQIEES